MTNDTWCKVQGQLVKAIGQNNFKTWIEPLEFVSCDSGIVVFNVPTNFMGNYVSQNFADDILHYINAEGVPAARLDFKLVAASAIKSVANTSQAPAPSTTPKPVVDVSDDIMMESPLQKDFTFDNFVVGKPNELAHAAARRVAEGGHVTFNPLFLYGGVGLGKTHLMHAIAHELKDKRPDLKVLYLSADKFMYRFIQAIRGRKTMDFKSTFRNVDILMIDDVQFIAGKESTQEEFFHTFNALIGANKQIIISGDRAPGEIKDMEERIRSRLQSGLIVDLHPTNFELRLGILQTKAELHADTYPGIEMQDGILEFLAHRISKNVRVLEGALTRLFAFAHLVGREITMDLAQDCLSDILRESDRKVSIDEIQRLVCEHFNIRHSDLIGPRRMRSLARPRQIAMYLAKEMTSRSLPEIGRKFGGRDHTTVMHGVKTIKDLAQTDSGISEDLELLRRTLEA
ncbi:chromosomal replication initiator protein DnaA [Nereida sp. MMG025]|uniref:chromosomal replication initiator protein DnaA n=1 Tax=Nereida sp. MMG025 TaxID=2909981 RepID=UPI001F00E018|nr:chromosomal replication initiator protein DnaA [Nereida sp. MMG025]MCF6444700.1 chromosomal replication initiator protein DnaA [Nereida sp. MMG025]